MTHTIAVGEFEGPLGILLELVERGKFEVTAISVADITAEYLDRIRTVGDRTPEELSEFLQLGARLLYIKSLALLPKGPAPEQAEELQLLNLELEEYQRMQLAARELSRLAATHTWTRPVTPRLALGDLPMPSIELSQLTEAFQKAMQQMEPQLPTQVIKRRVSLDVLMQRLKSKLATGSFDLAELLASATDRLEIVVFFMALLELIRTGTARVVQTDQFAPITVEPSNV
jgi:segregation and condensation protein A